MSLHQDAVCKSGEADRESYVRLAGLITVASALSLQAESRIHTFAVCQSVNGPKCCSVLKHVTNRYLHFLLYYAYQSVADNIRRITAGYKCSASSGAVDGVSVTEAGRN